MGSMHAVLYLMHAINPFVVNLCMGLTDSWQKRFYVYFDRYLHRVGEGRGRYCDHKEFVGLLWFLKNTDFYC